ncbi:unnamed protein product [Symbiodinium sp. CCMP2592]|nr:unnamed protein product [Symbiodinium sp. CCMP2592]
MFALHTIQTFYRNRFGKRMQKDRSAKPPTAMIIAEASLVGVSRSWGFKAEGLDLYGLGFRSQGSVPELDDETYV